MKGVRKGFEMKNYLAISRFRRLIYEQLQQFFPLSLLYVWVEILQDLILKNNSFINETKLLPIAHWEWVRFVSHGLGIFSRVLIYMMISFFTANLISRFLKEVGHHHRFDSQLALILVWIIYGYFDVNTGGERTLMPVWLFFILFAYIYAFLVMRLGHVKQQIKWTLAAILVFVTTVAGVVLMNFPEFDLHYLLQFQLSQWIGTCSQTLLQVLGWSLLAPCLLLIGLTVPEVMSKPNFDLAVTTENFNAALSHSTTSLPHPFTLYTVQNAFGLFGGVGLLLGLVIALFFQARRFHLVKYQRLVGLTAIPLVFNQPLPILVGLPVLFQPILIIPMLLSTLFAELFGSLCLHFGLVSTAVYSVPAGTPNLLFGFLASNGDWRYFIVIALILAVSALIYKPFVALALSREVE